LPGAGGEVVSAPSPTCSSTFRLLAPRTRGDLSQRTRTLELNPLPHRFFSSPIWKVCTSS
jgi:hypothetical protein